VPFNKSDQADCSDGISRHCWIDCQAPLSMGWISHARVSCLDPEKSPDNFRESVTNFHVVIDHGYSNYSTIEKRSFYRIGPLWNCDRRNWNVESFITIVEREYSTILLDVRACPFVRQYKLNHRILAYLRTFLQNSLNMAWKSGTCARIILSQSRLRLIILAWPLFR
jgi:hypothetical protein